MKRVVIVRHAKAVHYGYDDDFTRDLAERGVNDANILGKELKKRKIIPDRLISSPANRALQTARIYADNFGIDKSEIVEVEEIYDGLTISEFIDLIRELPDELETVFFFGHNPGFHYYVNNLSDKFNGHMPTCSTVGIDFNINTWKELGSEAGKHKFHYYPKMFK